MPSPFPGMDPYLESPSHWGSFHQWLTTAIAAHLNRSLPSGYVAELDQYVWLANEPGGERDLLGRPDAFVTPRPDRPEAEEGGVAVAVEVVAEPTLQTTLPKFKKRKQGFVKITTADGAEVLAVVELLSPSNKSTDRAAYLAKRNEYLAAGVNLLEIDLLRAGDRLPVGKPQPPATDYYIVLCRADSPGRASVWAFGVREPVPVVPLPFKAGVAPAVLDLRACLDRAYDDGRYRDKLRYARPTDPPLRKDDAEWAGRSVLASAGVG